MADQGDSVEEDLFADLYDVDESTHQQPAPSTSAAGAGASAGTGAATGTGVGAAATPAVPAAAAAPASTVADVSAAIPSISSFNNSTNRSAAAAAPFHSQPNQNAYDYTKHDSTSTSAYNYSQQYSHDAYTINPNTTPAMLQNAPAHQAAANQETSQISSVAVSDQPQGTGIKEDGKMFIGGLNWETTDQSLMDYFSQFGEVQECTVMRDGATGRSRGFGFLTFKDPKTVNTVMVKEHYLDGKIIDPKRAIPRDEQERTSKIFVGGVSQDATEQDFKQFFMQFGRVVDATLMIDKDTGRPRGFGFVTFDSEAAVEATLAGPLEILGKPIEVKKAQPRNNLRDDDRGRRMNDRFREGGERPLSDMAQMQTGQPAMSGFSPQMMAQYWQRMQQYFMMVQQQMAMAASHGQNMGMGMGMSGMNPMMQQMQAQMANMTQGLQQGNANAGPQSSTPQGLQGMMAASMMPTMGQNQQTPFSGPSNGVQSPVGASMAPTGSTGGASGNNNNNNNNSSSSSSGGGNNNNANSTMTAANTANGKNGPGYNAQEQLAFEQQKYEQQQARRATDSRPVPPYQQGGQSSWEGMYDECTQPSTTPQGRGTPVVSSLSPRQQSASGKTPVPSGKGPSPVSQPVCTPPANAPTGPRNAGKPGANYRGGGRGGHRGFHPYSRS